MTGLRLGKDDGSSDVDKYVGRMSGDGETVYIDTSQSGDWDSSSVIRSDVMDCSGEAETSTSSKV